MLAPGEQVLQSAYMRRQPGLVMQLLLVGGLLLFLITKAYLVVLTNRRMILIRTKMSFWSGGPQQLNLGIEQHDVRNFRGCSTSGIANNRSMTFAFHQGPEITLRISPWNKKIAGTAQFLEQVPQMISTGYLAQQAAGAPALQPMQAPPVQQPQAPNPVAYQQPQAMQPPQPHQAFPPGTGVYVLYPDGNRYPATIAQAASGQYLCTMQDGQSYWFPIQNVAVA